MVRIDRVFRTIMQDPGAYLCGYVVLNEGALLLLALEDGRGVARQVLDLVERGFAEVASSSRPQRREKVGVETRRFCRDWRGHCKNWRSEETRITFGRKMGKKGLESCGEEWNEQVLFISLDHYLRLYLASMSHLFQYGARFDRRSVVPRRSLSFTRRFLPFFHLK